MSAPQGKESPLTRPVAESLFQRVAAILDRARGNVARSVNTTMVLAYWLIGREIVQELQGGDERAAYGKQVVENLSSQLTETYGRGFSTSNLWYFRQFYTVFASRMEILHPRGGESGENETLRPAGGDLNRVTNRDETQGEPPRGFAPELSWSPKMSGTREFFERLTARGVLELLTHTR